MLKYYDMVIIIYRTVNVWRKNDFSNMQSSSVNNAKYHSIFSDSKEIWWTFLGKNAAFAILIKDAAHHPGVEGLD